VSRSNIKTAVLAVLFVSLVGSLFRSCSISKELKDVREEQKEALASAETNKRLAEEMFDRAQGFKSEAAMFEQRATDLQRQRAELASKRTDLKLQTNETILTYTLAPLDERLVSFSRFLPGSD
jgi:predicted  nucleic acid-binding Zn-ribbon protein